MYQGCFLTHFNLIPASVLILMEAASAAVTVCFTDCIKFWAFPISISVASRSSSVPEKLSKYLDFIKLDFKTAFTLCSKHSSFDSRQNLQLCSNGWNSLTNLQQSLKNVFN